MDFQCHTWSSFYLNVIHLISFDTPLIWLFHGISWQSRQCITVGVILGSSIINGILTSRQLNTQCCRQDAASKGIPCLRQSNNMRGLWSESNEKRLPNRYQWNFLIPVTIASESFFPEWNFLNNSAHLLRD